MKLVRAGQKVRAAEKRADRLRLLELKPRAKWVKEAQSAFNAFIRWRDRDAACISCGKEATARGSWDAGHYIAAGAQPGLRFDEDGCNKQCVKCNQHLHGNLVMYRLGLIARRGLAIVERLESAQEPKTHTIEELREIRDRYRRLVREARKES